MKNLVLVLLLALGISSSATAFTWKAIFIAGDDSIANFDNGREDLATMLSKLGKIDAIHLSSARNQISQARGVYPATIQNISKAFMKFPVSELSEGCLVHMTSHGSKHQGFYLSLSGILTPQHFAGLVNERCGNAPTVVLISACYSGQFITESLKGPNRIILTAASAERPSFGCSPDTHYTYWDGCLLEEIPRSETWVQLEQRVRSCITKKETALGVPSSNPQAYFGQNTKNWGILK